jgi:nucleoid DNA-binding protein
MTSKEFINFISKKLNLSIKDTRRYSKLLIEILIDSIKKENQVEILGFGKFLKNKNDKIILEPDKEFIQEINQK